MWLGNLEKKLTESDCRILITHWVYKRLQSADYKKIKIRYSCFEKTGRLIATDGLNETKINPEGLTNYAVPKSLAIQISEDALNCPVSESAPEPDSIIMNNNFKMKMSQMVICA